MSGFCCLLCSLESSEDVGLKPQGVMQMVINLTAISECLVLPKFEGVQVPNPNPVASHIRRNLAFFSLISNLHTLFLKSMVHHTLDLSPVIAQG